MINYDQDWRYWTEKTPDKYRNGGTIRTKIIQEFLPKENEIPSLRILDVGCEKGNETIQLSFLYPNHKILGIDINEEHIHSCENRIDKIITGLKKDKKIKEDERKITLSRLENIEFEVGDGYEINFKEKFSMIFFMNNILFVLQKNQIPNLCQILENVNNHLGKNGFLIFTANHEFIILKKGKNYSIYNQKIENHILNEAINEIIECLNS